MKLSEIFELGKSQYELDFVDIDPGKDIPLFIDPYFLSKRTDPWSINASMTIYSFFDYLIGLLSVGNVEKAKEICRFLGEPNETRLGFSRATPRGNGVGEIQAEMIIESLMKSRAVEKGVLDKLEDCRIFVHGVDRDKISDIATNIIRGHLLEYTQQQCMFWGIPLQSGIPSGFIWDAYQREWNNDYTDRLMVNDSKLLLIPKAIVSYSQKFTAQQYHQHFVLNYLQNEHLQMDSLLVQRHTRQDGTERTWVTKKSVRDHEAPLDKAFLADFTQKHPEVFQNFREQTAATLSSITNEELMANEGVEDQLNQVVDHLIATLRGIQPGNDQASRYHKTIAGILELLFYPNLVCPQIEQKVHQGRKRIDITFHNSARDGFFWRLHKKHNIPCGFIAVECKNYSSDVSNEELDQLSGRFSPNRGKFGLLVCRTIDDMDTFIDRCTDTFRDDRGVIIPLVDSDLLSFLEELKNGTWHPEERLLNGEISGNCLSLRWHHREYQQIGVQIEQIYLDLDIS